MSDRGLELLRECPPEVWRGADLKYIGMPVGGLFAGTVYLGGDGQLWNWDIFNQERLGCGPRKDAVFMGEALNPLQGANYVDPLSPSSPFAQHWRIEREGSVRSLIRFGEVAFRGEYPIGKAAFSSADDDLELSLEAFSPFCPLDAENSSFPATTLTFRLRNTGEERGYFSVVYKTENPALLFSKAKLPEAVLQGGKTPRGGLIFSCEGAGIEENPDWGEFCVEALGGEVQAEASKEGGELRVSVSLEPGEEREATLVIAWWFPNCVKSLPGKRHWYSTKWSGAEEAADEILTRWSELQGVTRSWNRTWYDSTLPAWVLDRTFANISTLATTTCFRLDEGRYWFWEGVGCCPGTCTHVWGYAQGIGRVFPEVEKALREEIDYGMAFHEDTGAIDYRAEFDRRVAVDGQASCILRAYREHQMSRDDGFLQRLWPKIRKSMENLISIEGGEEGVLRGGQYNTLDTEWHGEIAWISSLYIAALRACEAMAGEMSDGEFESRCRALAEKGSSHLVENLFNGEYFIHKVDPAHPESNNTNDGCHSDQIYGQTWAHQVGLPRVVPKEEATSALKAIFRYNFYEDVWEYRRKIKAIPGGRWYATPEEPGLIMCSFPRGGAELASGQSGDKWAAIYFNETWTGYEHHVASCMIAEGLLEEGLTILRAVHDRHHPRKRNPYNEVECSDHYGRALASYGVFVSLTGFRCHGPKGEMSFNSPLQGAQRFPFIAPDGWGTWDSEGGVTYAHRMS